MERLPSSKPFWEYFLISYVRNPELQAEFIKEAMDHYKLSLKDFSIKSGIPEGTLYKISSSTVFDIRISTLNKMIKTFRALETIPESEAAIGVISARYALQDLSPTITIEGKEYVIAEYPASTIEEEIIQGIKAENEGCVALICGPIAANTLNRVVQIPVIGLHFNPEQMRKAIQEAIGKISK
ncbi:MAG: helix-turn-helix domain-containing protein [Candidatus Hodarchaeales archaeon]